MSVRTHQETSDQPTDKTDMDPRCVEDIAKMIVESGVSHVMVGVVDLNGTLRAKHLAAEKILSGLNGDLRFCDVVLGFDSDDTVFDNTHATGWHTGFRDEPIRLAPESCRRLPGERDSYLLLADYAEPLDAVCPRSLLRRIIEHARTMGFRAAAAFEYEICVLEETPHSLREKGFRNLRPVTPGAFAYSALRSSVWRELYDDILDTCEQLRAPLEGLHPESGAGMLEAAIKVDGALEAADRAVIFKTFVKALAQRRSLMATFMSRWSLDWPGQGGHIHLSLQDNNGDSVFYDPATQEALSETMRYFIGGQQRLLPELCAMFAPTVNSYSRLVPGYWAPTQATWGMDNRTCALRVVPGTPRSQRVEYRVPGADSNPYLALGAALGSGLWGIQHQIEPSPPSTGNAYESRGESLPATLGQAAARLQASTAARELFGETFVEHFVKSREWEEQEFHRHVTDWELERYLEII